jgi:iron complex outermembrane recepter protein
VAGDLLLQYRAAELGPRVNDIDSDAQRYVIGVEGVAGGWDYSVAAVYSRNTQSDTFKSGFVYVDRMIAAMATGLINPFGASGPEGQALLASTQFYGTPHSTEGTTSLVNAVASREIAALPAGALTLALGVEARREKLTNDWQPVLVSGFTANEASPSVAGSRTDYALFAELNVPIARGLEAQLALRYDDYSDFGSTTNPKVAARWQPLPALLVRGSWGTGFRAPPLYDLYRPRSTGNVSDIVDPIRCPVTGSPNDCDADIVAVFGGNPNLEPETSTQWNIGVVLEPTTGLSMGLDYWQIEQNDVIGTIGPRLGLALYDTYGWRAIRGPADPLQPSLPGPLIGFDDTLMNLGTTRTSGIDVSFTYVAPRTDWGVLRVSLQGTYVLEWARQLEGATEISALGTDAVLQAIPRWRSQFTLNWNSGAWGATLAQTYTSGYSDFRPDVSGEPRKVSAFAPWDLQGTYSGFRGWQWVAGIRNLFNTDPPVSNQRRFFQIGYNPQLANPLGRLFYLRATYAWK